ncbi:MAG: hypothetical protein DMG06_11225 [Acidobacteria bacterium]|nr:MAG: hypothetical protein DMG06_11225 [Acidobacteriota bacterium]
MQLLFLFLSTNGPDRTRETKDFLNENKSALLLAFAPTETSNLSSIPLIRIGLGFIPATFLFGRKRKRVETLVGGQASETLEKAFQPLL